MRCLHSESESARSEYNGADSGYNRTDGEYNRARSGYKSADGGYSRARRDYNVAGGKYKRAGFGYNRTGGGYNSGPAGYNRGGAGYNGVGAVYILRPRGLGGNLRCMNTFTLKTGCALNAAPSYFRKRHPHSAIIAVLFSSSSGRA